MTVNPFWFGVLITIVAEIVVVILLALVVHKRDDEEESAEVEEAIVTIAEFLDGLKKEGKDDGNGKTH